MRVVEIRVLGQRRQDDAISNLSLDEYRPGSLHCAPRLLRPNVERGTCDQVDCVMYLMTELMRRLPSTSKHVSRLEHRSQLVGRVRPSGGFEALGQFRAQDRVRQCEGFFGRVRA